MNAFKTDVNGLPMLDAAGNETSNVTTMINDMGVASADPGRDWARGSSGQTIGGPFFPIKNV